MLIEKIDFDSEEFGSFIDEEFGRYAEKYGVSVDYDEFCFAARDGEKLIGLVTGHAYYKEVHVSDLVVREAYRGQGVGSALLKKVEEEYGGKNYENINLTTYAFQALEFYRKCGYEVEYVRENADEKLTKYFLIKHL
ncbi:MAG: GNAT family N-acetyltransferase [Lachnospiraceae bacterium]|nr:GNAT family N-acetyltransferase [Lachnospiraceae bacterium]